MDRYQAVHEFWSSFDLPAYDETTVPTGEDAPDFPYITYAVSIGALGDYISLSASVWYKGNSWHAISKKVDEIAEKVASRGFYKMELDDGYLWLTQGTPFAQRMSDPEDDQIRRYYLQLDAEFLTAY